MTNIIRCAWVSDDPLYQAYHDQEWGRALHDSKALFALLMLEGAQAGLSWLTVLKRREGYMQAFDGLDPEHIAHYDSARVEQLLQDPGIIRHRGKIEACIGNARAWAQIQADGSHFSDWVWRFVDGQTLQNQRPDPASIPATTEQSDALAKALKKAGFKFVGSTICYAFMQAAGLVNDHTRNCHCYHVCGGH